MDIDEPVKTACGQTLREATGTITLHISASLSADNVSYAPRQRRRRPTNHS